jgi:hypothetical protein
MAMKINKIMKAGENINENKTMTKAYHRGINVGISVWLASK